MRTEKDLLGELALPEAELYGIHTARAIDNFPLTNRTVHPELISAYGKVKLAESENKTVRAVVLEKQYLTEKEFDELITAENVTKLGF